MMLHRGALLMEAFKSGLGAVYHLAIWRLGRKFVLSGVCAGVRRDCTRRARLALFNARPSKPCDTGLMNRWNLSAHCSIWGFWRQVWAVGIKVWDPITRYPSSTLLPF